jgi:hypothetical protein
MTRLFVIEMSGVVSALVRADGRETRHPHCGFLLSRRAENQSMYSKPNTRRVFSVRANECDATA